MLKFLTLTFTTMELLVFGLAANAQSSPLTIFTLKQDGWEVMEKNSYLEVRSGKPPYSNLKRYLQVEVYILQKKNNRFSCTMEYDSQSDTLTEECLKL